jgi:hypothetical protein
MGASWVPHLTNGARVPSRRRDGVASTEEVGNAYRHKFRWVSRPCLCCPRAWRGPGRCMLRASGPPAVI